MGILLGISAILLVSGGLIDCSDIWPQNEWKPLQSASKCAANSAGKRYCSGSDPCASRGFVFCFGPSLEYPFNCTDTTPYCEESTAGQAVCSASPPSGCSTTATTDFVCTGQGIYPDPLDCKKFYYCFTDANGLLRSQLGTCPDRYVFDPDSTSFCRYTNNYYCTLPNCNNVNQLKNVQFIYNFFPYNRQYVALCVPNEKPLVFKCEANYTPNLSSIPITCSFKCKSPGQYPYPGSNTLYHDCVYNSKNQLEALIKSCFTGWTFDVDHCQPPPVTTSSSTTATTSSTSTGTSTTSTTDAGTTSTISTSEAGTTSSTSTSDAGTTSTTSTSEAGTTSTSSA